MAVPAIPVLSFRPNWKEGLTESLIWLTDVLTSDSGAEQRRSLRLSPARQFEASFMVQGAERTFFDLFLSRAGNQEMFVPLWHDIGRSRSVANQGSYRVQLETTYREFAVGGFAILQGSTAFDYEVVEIVSIDPLGLDFAAPLAARWPVGTKVMPLRRGRINPDDGVTYGKPNSRVAESTFRVNLTEPNDWTFTGPDPLPQYAGYPVFTLRPDVRDALDMQFARMMTVLGNDFGKSFYADSAQRAFVAQGHAWYLKGRRAQAEFRDFLYRMQGRTKAFWLPTFNDDLRLVTVQGAADTMFEVERTGFALSGGPGPGREYLTFFMRDGSVVVRKIAGLLNPTVPGRERITLTASLGVAFSPATVRSISFTDLARLDQDQIDLTHHTDTDGITTVTGVFRTFGDTRDASGPIYYPIPISYQSDNPCGEGGDPCIPLYDNSPYRIVVRRLTADICSDCLNCWDGEHQVNWQPFQPNGPGGKILQGGLFAFNERLAVENNVPGNPNLRGQMLLDFKRGYGAEWTLSLGAKPTGGASVLMNPWAYYCRGKDPGAIELVDIYDGVEHSRGVRAIGDLSNTYWEWII